MHGGRERLNALADSELRRRVHDIMRCRVSRDYDRMMRHFSPDVVVYYACSKEGLFRPGVWEGREAFRENIRRTDIDYAPIDGEMFDVLVEGDRAAVRWRSVWRHHGTGQRYTLDMAHFLRWENDLVVEVHEFLDNLGSNIPVVRSLLTLDQIISPPTPGLERGEMIRRAMSIVDFHSHGPDNALLQQWCSPDIVCEFVGDRARIPYSGRHTGLQALINIIRAIAIDFEQSNNSVAEILVDGGRLAIRRTVDWRHRGTGRSGLVDLADFARVEDGLVVEIIEYRDSITVLEMQGELEEQ